MPVIFQHRRGTTAELSTVTGAVGELFVDTTKNTVVVMDGTTAGGTPLATEAMISAQLGEVSVSTVSVMKASNLNPGSFIRTKGYHNSGDGGHGDYFIMSSVDYGKQPDGYGDHYVANGNVAVLVYQYRANILQFGAFNDGTTDNYPAFIAAANAGIPLEFPSRGNFKLVYEASKYSTPIIFKASVNFNNSKIAITGTNTHSPSQSGRILIFSTSSYGHWTNHDSSSALVTALKTETTVTGKYFAGLNDYADFANCYLRINTDQPSYRYRSDNTPGGYNREELMVHTRDGQMISTLKYPLDTVNITSVDVLPISRHYTTYENLIIDVSGADTTLSRYAEVRDASNIRLDNFTFELDNSRVYDQTPPPVLFPVNNSCFVEVDGLYAGSPIKSLVDGAVTYAYVFQTGGCFDVKWKNVVSQGDGWGANSGDVSARVSYENCDLNRIDFHRPFYEYLNVRNCTIGNWGIKVTAIGNLNVEGCTFNVGGAPFYNANGFITTRGDAGGWCDGHLYMNNCVFNNNTGNPLYLQTAATGVEDVQPTESALTFWNWESQTIQNCVVGAGEVIFGNFSNGEDYIVEAETITASNVRCSNGAKFTIRSTTGIRTFKQDLTTFTSPRFYNAPPNRNVNIRDCDVDSIHFDDAGETCLLNVIIDNVRGNNGIGSVLTLSQQGTYNVTNSILDSVLFSDSTLAIKATIENNVINATTKVPVGNISNKYHGGRGDDVTIKNNVISVPSSLISTNNPYFAMLSGKCINNTVTAEGSAPTTTYRPSWPQEGVAGVITNFNYDNKVQFDVGPSGNQTPWTHADYKSADMSIPRVVGQSTFATLDVSNNATITMTASNQLTLDAGALNINALRYKL